LKLIGGIGIVLLKNNIAVSTDCPGVIVFANSLNIDIQQPAIYSKLQSNCCTATGVTCDGTPRVTSIIWSGFILNGTLNTAIGVTLPSALTKLDMSVNSIDGTVPTSWPSSLTYLDLSHNRFTGTIPGTWPTGFKTLYLAQTCFLVTFPKHFRLD
jgi:hypothetical protein